jgi:hypothetical protein
MFRIRRVGNVGAPATVGREREKITKPLDDGDTFGCTGTLVVIRSGRTAFRREQWECSENEHRGRKKKTEQREGT